MKKNIYGTKQAAANFYDYLCKGLLDQGFTPSISDPCLWIRDDCIICQYVDDCLIFAHDDSVIDSFLAKMKQAGYLLSDEGSVEDFLGVHVDKKIDSDGKKIFEMTQTGLIQEIIDDLNLDADQTKLHKTPSNSILFPDLDQDPFEEEWNYRSVIGKLNFLALNSCPDIAFSVHQCARFCTNPRASHGTAVKQIGRYLKSTKDKGLILCPDGTHSLHAMCDADFAGTWSAKYANHQSTALS